MFNCDVCCALESKEYQIPVPLDPEADSVKNWISHSELPSTEKRLFHIQRLCPRCYFAHQMLPGKFDPNKVALLSQQMPPGLVTQTRVGRPAGNCTEACIASILAIPLHDLPSLWSPGDTDVNAPDFRLAGWVRLHNELRRRRFMWCSIPIEQSNGQPCLIPLAQVPERVMPCIVERFGAPVVEASYHLLLGHNHNGEPHATVAIQGKQVWDPNPNRRGLRMVDEVVYLLPMVMLPADRHDWPGCQFPPVVLSS